MTQIKKQIGISLDRETFEYVDSLRGEVPRSRYLEGLINIGIATSERNRRL